MPYQFEVWVFQQMSDVLSCAGVELVHAQNVMALVEQAFTQVRAQETGTTGD